MEVLATVIRVAMGAVIPLGMIGMIVGVLPPIEE